MSWCIVAFGVLCLARWLIVHWNNDGRHPGSTNTGVLGPSGENPRMPPHSQAHQYPLSVLAAYASDQRLPLLPSLTISAPAPFPCPHTSFTTSRSLRALTVFHRNSTELQFNTLVDISVIDKLLARGRFSITYHLLSVKTNQRCSLQLLVKETTTIPSLAAPFVFGRPVFASAR